MTVKLWLGVLLGFATIAGLVLTLTVLYAVIKLGIITKKNPIYVISAANMMCDTIQLLLALLYLAPSIIFDDWIFKGGRRGVMVELLSATFLACWYYGSVAQILMAVNRLVVVCFPTNSIFSMRNVSIFVIMLLPVAIFTSWISQYVMPCCKFSFDHKFLSYSYTSIEDVFNYSNSYIDLPLNSSSSAICAICYTYIIFYVWKMNHLYIKDAAGSRNRMKEYRYALQFCAISMFYLGAWVTFRVFPVLIGDRGVEYFIVVSMCVTVNSSANAFVYITSNQEVRTVLLSKRLSTVHHVSSTSRAEGGTTQKTPTTTANRSVHVTKG